MNFTGQAIPLPLDSSINRCLGQGHKEGEWCDRRDTCACHQTIEHDPIKVAAAYRKCWTDKYSAYLPLDGFPMDEREEEKRTT